MVVPLLPAVEDTVAPLEPGGPPLVVVVVDTGAVVVATVTEGAVVVATGTGTGLGGLKDAKGAEALVVATVVRTPPLTTFWGFFGGFSLWGCSS